jgi:lysine-N-methylase
MPEYMKDFQCIGSKCEDSCCKLWSINIDKDTYDKYSNITNKNLKVLFDKNIEKQNVDSYGEYAKIKLNDEGLCPFLNTDKLCCIQSELGEEYLSETCAQYPRIFNVFNGLLEKSATLSCPYAAEVALLNEDGIKFLETKEDFEISVYSNIEKIQDDKVMFKKSDEFFFHLRKFCIDLIQDRSYELWQRLIILGMFLKDIENLENESVNNLILNYKNIIKNGYFREELNNIPLEIGMQLKALKDIADKRFISGGKNNERYSECYKEVLLGIDYYNDVSMEQISERFKASLDAYFQTFMRDKGYILENYLVNYIFEKKFPNTNNTFFESFIVLSVNYSIIRMILIGMLNYYKGNLDDKKVVKLVQSFVKVSEHNSKYTIDVINSIKYSNIDDLTYMSMLIRS